MTKRIALLTGICLLTMVAVVSAQQQEDNTQKFIGEWKLNVDKSELGERSRIESMTMKVTKVLIDGNESFSVTRTTKRAERDGDRRLRGRFGRGRGGSIDGKNVETVTYDLSGKETKSDISRGRMAGKSTAKIKTNKDGSMTITQNTELDSPRGLMEIENTETWGISADGRTLTISNERKTPRGNMNSTMVFTKMVPTALAGNTNSFEAAEPGDLKSLDSNVIRKIKGGVVNGKAISLPAPTYPRAARAAAITGSVNVQVVIDKEGNVKSAEALSGHPLLRKSSVKAAKKAKFRPTRLEGQPVEVIGVIVYNYN